MKKFIQLRQFVNKKIAGLLIACRRTLIKWVKVIELEIGILKLRIRSEAGGGPTAVHNMLDLEQRLQDYKSCIRWLDAQVERLRTDKKSSELKPGEAS